MIPGPFAYHAPRGFDEAFALLDQHGEDAKILSGGQSLIPVMKLRLAEPAHVVDINRLPGLRYVSESDGWLRIGALAREADLERSEVVRRRYPLLSDTAGVIADPLVRNLATIAGNLAHADPANDHPATMLAYHAELVARGPSGERVIPIDEFFVDAFATTLAGNEIITEVRVPAPSGQTGGAYVKFERKVGDFAIAAAAVQVRLNADGTVAEIGIGVTNVSFAPMRAKSAEQSLFGQRLTAETINAAAGQAAQECDPASDLRGSAEYKRAMVRTMTARALRLAHSRATAAA
jgi:carbon-monoxide dehydrogenase medium subunit